MSLVQCSYTCVLLSLGVEACNKLYILPSTARSTSATKCYPFQSIKMWKQTITTGYTLISCSCLTISSVLLLSQQNTPIPTEPRDKIKLDKKRVQHSIHVIDLIDTLGDFLLISHQNNCRHLETNLRKTKTITIIVTTTITTKHLRAKKFSSHRCERKIKMISCRQY